ncbi:ribonuclease toxin HepT-like protein [Limnochorda pilosa]|uniref:HepT-like domain-containing protein n=1 Tax=Limnochorda pilosa TaxID=1555112 RepID=A0A0K2SII5_LIMPI|nr:hypothetical protein [Limnochorda pilosa]BAS26900.1 hypothetical protein LIP_1043 [Limnochorda pilosa]
MREAAALRRLASEIATALGEVETITQEGEELAASLPAMETPKRPTLRALGSVLHDFYTAVEDVFELIAADLDGGVPTTSDWHRRLLRSMEEPVKEVRPRVISPELGVQLRDYLGFRHVFRNVYGHRLEWTRMMPLVEGLPALSIRFRAEAEEFCRHLEALADRLEGETP